MEVNLFTICPFVPSSRDKVEIVSVLKHSPTSTAEGHPGILRVVVPPYLAYVEGSDSFSTNYTATYNLTDAANAAANVTSNATFVEVEVRAEPHHHTFDFAFNGGITYSDIIHFNFTLTVDATKRPIGSGAEASTIVLSPVCKRNVFDNYPAAAAAGQEYYEYQTQCGDLVGVEFSTVAPGDE